jgi:hypothetical protein
MDELVPDGKPETTSRLLQASRDLLRDLRERIGLETGAVNDHATVVEDA